MAKKSDKLNKIAVVTGGSRGIGKATVEKFASGGWTVYELSRHTPEDSVAVHLTADITVPEQVNAAIEEIIAREGKIDLLVNNAGYGISGAAEFTEVEEAKKMFDADFFGMFNLTKAVAPHMRDNGGGKIINLSSIAAVVSIPFQAFYSAAKAATNSFTLSMINELKPFNIKVCAVLPGDIKTGFTAARQKFESGDEIYDGRISRSVAAMEKDETNGMAPQKIADKIFSIAHKKNPKPFYTVGFSYKSVFFLAKHLPYGFTNNIISKIYNK